VRRRLRFHLRLLARLGFLDGARIRGNAALRAKLGLAFHLGTLERNAGCVSIGFRACGCLGGAGALGRFACPCHGEGATLGIRRRAHARLVRHRERLHRRRAGWRIARVAGLRADIVRNDLVGRALALFAVTLDFASHELGPAYVV
jgi:hypothetical protein